MGNPSDQGSTSILQGAAAQTIVRETDAILLTWEARVRKKVVLAKSVPRPVLIDTLPLFMGNLAQALADNHPRGSATEANDVAQEHGGERARITRFGPQQIIQEYQILRAVVEETLEKAGALGPAESAVIQLSFDQAVQDAMTAYFLVHGRVREQFIATLSHDLRNPLNVMKLSADLILEKLADPIDSDSIEGFRLLARKIVNNAVRADRLIQNLLDANMVNVGERMQLNLAECEMLALVRGLVEELDKREQQRIRVIGEPACGYWDMDALHRALDNMVTNAFKYGDSETDVTIKVATKLGRVMVSVHNKGNPIPVDEKEYLFQAFRRSQSAKQSGNKGWGIGLALVRGVAEAHGGSLGLDSAPENGTTFTMDLPADARPFQDCPISG